MQTVCETVQVPETVNVQVVRYKTETRTEQRQRIVCEWVTETVNQTVRECVRVPVQRQVQVPTNSSGTVVAAAGACGTCDSSVVPSSYLSGRRGILRR
jgi:hypothetical protein